MSVPVTRACVRDVGVVLPGTSHALEVAIDGRCFCGEILSCTVRVSGAVIDLSTSVCEGELLCDGCFPNLTGACELPPLAEGTYLVRVNGEEAFDLPVSSTIPGVAVDNCWTVADPVPPSGFMCDWPGWGLPESVELCHPSEADVGRAVEITVVDVCADCFQVPGQCQVQLSGSALVVMPRERSCVCHTCGACEDVCQRLSVTCLTPPLAPGVYDVVYGEVVTSLRVEPGARSDAVVCSAPSTSGV